MYMELSALVASALTAPIVSIAPSSSVLPASAKLNARMMLDMTTLRCFLCAADTGRQARYGRARRLCPRGLVPPLLEHACT